MRAKNSYSQPKLSPLPLLIVIVSITTLPSFANCADAIASWDIVKPAQSRLFQQLKSCKTYPWGNLRPYGSIGQSPVIQLTSDFEKLSAPQKRKALELLRLECGAWPKELLNDEERQFLQSPERARLQGAMSPVVVTDASGRTVSLPYDGCTRYTLLTEYDRHNYECGMRELKRTAQYPLSKSEQTRVSKLFWRLIGPRDGSVLWIGWVPECGYFEIDIDKDKEAHARRKLKNFLHTATKYKFVIVSQDASG